MKKKGILFKPLPVEEHTYSDGEPPGDKHQENVIENILPHTKKLLLTILEGGGGGVQFS